MSWLSYRYARSWVQIFSVARWPLPHDIEEKKMHLYSLHTYAREGGEGAVNLYNIHIRCLSLTAKTFSWVGYLPYTVLDMKT